MTKEKSKKWYLRWWMFIIYFLIVLIIITSIPGGEKEEAEQLPKGKEVAYKIIEKQDFSYAGCKRIGIRITVSDDADKKDVGYTMEQIINDYKSKWDDITVWAYKYSEEEQALKFLPYTMGMKEYSVCD